MRVRPALSAIVVVPILVLTFAAPARAIWRTGGIAVGLYPTSYALAADGSGGLLVPWCSSSGAWFERFSANGDTLIAPPGSPLPASLVGQLGTVMFPDGLGGRFMSFGYSLYGGLLLHVDATLTPTFGPIDAGTVIVPATPGRVLSFQQPAASPTVECFTSTGAVAPGWPAMPGVTLCTASLGYRNLVGAVSDSSGGAYVVWSDYRDGIADTYAQHVLANGSLAAGWDPGGIRIRTAAGEQTEQSLVADGSGGAVIAWVDDRAGLTFGHVQLQRIRPSGALAWGVGDASPSTVASPQSTPLLAQDTRGGVYVVWQDARNGPPQLMAQRMDSTGAVAPGWPAGGLALCNSPHAQTSAAIAADATGLYAAWVDTRDGTHQNVYAQRLDASGAVGAGWSPLGVGIGVLTANQSHVAILPDGTGGAFVGWVLDAGSWFDLRAGRVDASGVVPVRLSFVSAAVARDAVTLTWDAGGDRFASADVQRRDENEAWITLGSVSADGTGRLMWRDATISPGRAYEYRLWIGGEARGWTRVTVPGDALELGAVSVDARASRISAALLGGSGEAKVELFDVAGRRLDASRVTLSGGVTPVTIALDAPVRAGLLVLRASCAGRIIVRRIPVVP